jgi:hypothetical protein
VIIISVVEHVADFLVLNSYGTLGTDLFCYTWGSSYNNAIMVTSTSGLDPDRFLDQTTNRVVHTFVNILVRNSSMKDGLEIAEDLIELFEKNICSYFIDNKPRRDEVIYVGKEETTHGTFYLFGIDLRVISVKNNL